MKQPGLERQRGMATAEYACGTVGAAVIAMVIYKMGILGIDGPWLDGLMDRVKEALQWRSILRGLPGGWPW